MILLLLQSVILMFWSEGLWDQDCRLHSSLPVRSYWLHLWCSPSADGISLAEGLYKEVGVSLLSWLRLQRGNTIIWLSVFNSLYDFFYTVWRDSSSSQPLVYIILWPSFSQWLPALISLGFSLTLLSVYYLITLGGGCGELYSLICPWGLSGWILTSRSLLCLHVFRWL